MKLYINAYFKMLPFRGVWMCSCTSVLDKTVVLSSLKRRKPFYLDPLPQGQTALRDYVHPSILSHHLANQGCSDLEPIPLKSQSMREGQFRVHIRHIF